MTKWMDREVKPPVDRPLLVYCPGFNTTGYAVAIWTGKRFRIDDYCNFDSFVKLWALFMEAD